MVWNMSASKKDTQRAYTHMLVVFGKSLQDIVMELETLKESHFIGSYACILHDKDKYTEEDKQRDIENGRTPQNVGDIKTPHIHVLVTFKQNVSRNQIINRFIIQDLDKGISVLSKIVKDRYASYRYLTHKDNQEKTQYDDNDIIGWNIQNYETKLNTSQNTLYVEMYQDYESNETYYNMMIKYGRDYIINYQKYKEYFELIKSERGVK